MNRLLLILTAVICAVSMAGCYKDVQREQRTDILINHTWYIKGLWIGGSDKTDSCYLSEVTTFKKDSLGNHHYNLLCDANGPANQGFKWEIPNEWEFLYYYNIGGVKDSNLVCRIWVCNDDTLTIGGVLNGGVSMYAIYTSFQ